MSIIGEPFTEVEVCPLGETLPRLLEVSNEPFTNTEVCH